MTLQRAMSYCANLLSYRMQSVKQVRDKLKQKECDDGVIEYVIEHFSKLKLLDDLEFAKMYIHDAVNLSAKGTYRIKEELRMRGVSREIVEQALNESEGDELEQLKEYIVTRIAAREIGTYKEIEKLKAHLFRKGHSMNNIMKAIEELNIRRVR